MSITLPTGWKDFDSTPLEADLCGEPQDCDNPPCGDGTPPLTVEKVNLAEELVCDPHSGKLFLDMAIGGGVPPFTISTSEGLIQHEEVRIFRVKIDAAVLTDFDTGCEIVAAARLGREIWPQNFGDEHCEDQWRCSYAHFNCFGDIFSSVEDLQDSEFANDDPCSAIVDDILDHAPVDDPNNGLGLTNWDAMRDNWPLLCVPHFIWVADAQALDCGPACTPTPDGETLIKPVTCEGHDITNILEGDGVASNGQHHMLLNNVGTKVDLRTPASKALGCSPCVLLQGTDIIVTVTDAQGISVAIELPIH